MSVMDKLRGALRMLGRRRSAGDLRPEEVQRRVAKDPREMMRDDAYRTNQRFDR